MHKKLNEEEKKMLSDLQGVRSEVKQTCGVTVDSQKRILRNVKTLKSCQRKMIDKDSAYDYVTVTDFLKRDVHNYCELPDITWNSQILRRHQSEKLVHYRVDLENSVAMKKIEMKGFVSSDKKLEETGSEALDEQLEVKEVSRICLHAQDKGDVTGMVVYNQRVYVVHDKGLIVYCYTPDGSLSHTYEHKGGANYYVRAMALMMGGNTSMLVVSGLNSLAWIRIIDAVTMKHHHTQELGYSITGLHNDSGDMLVLFYNKIHHYRQNGWITSITKLSDNVDPCRIARHGDSDRYVVNSSEDIMVINSNGQVETHYNGEIQGVKLGWLDEGVKLSDVITDPHRGVLIASNSEKHKSH